MTALVVLADQLVAQANAGKLSAADNLVEIRFDIRLVREERRSCEVAERWCGKLEAIELHSRGAILAILRPTSSGLAVFAWGDEGAVAPWLVGWTRVGDRLWRPPQ